jgi:tRNA A37 N6-isopentenylltransferase MiaA
MIDTHTIKQEELLNQRLHEVLLKIKPADLANITKRNEVVYKIKEVFKRMGYVVKDELGGVK